MPKYLQSKIYKLVNDQSDDVYYGSTTLSLRERFELHKSEYIRKHGSCASSILFDTGVVSIELVENYPCREKKELLERETYYIKNFKNVNKQNAITSKEEKLEQINKWRKEHPEECKKAKEKYRSTEKGIETEKKYKEENKELYRKAQEKYYKNNKNKANERRRTKVECKHCGKTFNKNSLSTHIKRKHNE